MKSRLRLIVASAAIGLAGCAAGPSTRPVNPPSASSQVADAVQGRADLQLDQIEPSVALRPGKGSSVGHPPLEALHLYARGQIALLDGDRDAALAAFAAAAQADPLSYDLHVKLAHLYVKPGADFDDRSIAELEKAVDLEPDHLEIQLDLARQFISKRDATSALSRLRAAVKTRQYAADAPQAALADFFLATLLRDQGYEQAALDVYQRLSARLKRSARSAPAEADVGALREHADAIDAEIADLLVRRNRLDAAIDAYAGLVQENPGDFDLRTRQVRLLITSHHADRALVASRETAIHFRCDAASVSLLTVASAAAGHPDRAAELLSRLHVERPNDHAVLYAWIDALHADKRDAEADQVLRDAAGKDPLDFEIVRRQAGFAREAGRLDESAKILIHATAVAPDLVLESASLFADMSRASTAGRLSWSRLKAIDVQKEDEGAKWFWTARLADAAHRDDVAQDSLARAIAAGFSPAYARKMEQLWQRDDLPPADREKQAAELIAGAGAARGQAAARELEAQKLSLAGKPAEAAAMLAKLVSSAGPSAAGHLLLARIDALRKSGEDATADSLCWRLLSDRPTIDEVYEDFYLSSIEQKLDSQADHIVTLWLGADAHSVTARRISAIQFQRAGRIDIAERVLLDLFQSQPNDPQAIVAVSGFYSRRGESATKLVPLLQTQHDKEPLNLAVTTELAIALHDAPQSGDVAKVLDASRAAAGDDADTLYALSSLYAGAGLKQQAEEVLLQVLRLDPSHPGAANDLGFQWADAGVHLPDAEPLIRRALQAEPHNAAYLDSLGWVLYKRGKWAEARAFFDRAITPGESESSAPPDPVMLDHRGDVLYRLGESSAAVRDWRRAVVQVKARASQQDAETRSLVGRLAEKLRQVDAGQTVSVAPCQIAGAAATQP